MIPIVKPFLPPQEKYQQYLSGIYERNWLTNNGPLLKELEARLADYLGISNMMLVSNGTVALEVAYKALGVTSGEVLTTPFTFAATASSASWVGLSPRFVDIDADTLNMDVELLATNLSAAASAIVPVHVYGNPCNVGEIEKLGKQADLPVIYDAAHAFNVRYKGQSILNWGDASTLSLHATKVFHCVEGGAVVFKDKDVLERAKKLINFGFDENNSPTMVGTNAKLSEFHAAMGLSMLDHIDEILNLRQAVMSQYIRQLDGIVRFQSWSDYSQNNGAYAPVLFETPHERQLCETALHKKGIQSRRYFYPDLASLGVYAQETDCPISMQASHRVLCLPMHYALTGQEISLICETIKGTLATGQA